MLLGQLVPVHHASRATHLSSGYVDADAFPEHQLHVGRVAQLNHRGHRQVDPLVSRCATKLGAVVDRRVPGSLHLHLDHIEKRSFELERDKTYEMETLKINRHLTSGS